ncbi:hypothetical protein AVDCRST_MAG94-5609 [uncultured Leptolyngbya sp.]|uniref:Uncharacterized protein n=1 Tax=uncultured Leptolyngbya sp. TaxID=332963 RepID=A0A6J4NQT3_9CYAN|nr:hypothetical protein AVDCRST_MAG94-5609 [uncultured Leptolyngbya sp.]
MLDFVLGPRPGANIFEEAPSPTMTALMLLEVSELGVSLISGVGVGSGEELTEKVGVACTDGVGAKD